jgi:hypothetical protein
VDCVDFMFVHLRRSDAHTQHGMGAMRRTRDCLHKLMTRLFHPRHVKMRFP